MSFDDDSQVPLLGEKEYVFLNCVHNTDDFVAFLDGFIDTRPVVTPFFDLATQVFELFSNDGWSSVGSGLRVPNTRDEVIETRLIDPEVFKPEDG